MNATPTKLLVGALATVFLSAPLNAPRAEEPFILDRIVWPRNLCPHRRRQRR